MRAACVVERPEGAAWGIGGGMNGARATTTVTTGGGPVWRAGRCAPGPRSGLAAGGAGRCPVGPRSGPAAGVPGGFVGGCSGGRRALPPRHSGMLPCGLSGAVEDIGNVSCGPLVSSSVLKAPHGTSATARMRSRHRDRHTTGGVPAARPGRVAPAPRSGLAATMPALHARPRTLPPLARVAHWEIRNVSSAPPAGTTEHDGLRGRRRIALISL
jgi:hypothetical protein